MTAFNLQAHAPGARAATLVLVHSEPLTDPDAVVAALRSHGGAGWVCTTAEVVAVQAFEPPASGFPILSAELYDKEGQSSISVRWRDGRWFATTTREVPAGTPAAEEAVGFDDTWLASVAPPGAGRLPRVCYRTYWRRSPAPGSGDVRPYTPWVAAFRGIDTTEGER